MNRWEKERIYSSIVIAKCGKKSILMHKFTSRLINFSTYQIAVNLKLLLTCPDALIDKRTGTFFSGVESQIDNYLTLSQQNKIVVMSASGNGLSKIPSKFNPLKIPYKLRGAGDRLVNYVTSELSLPALAPIILGAKDEDMFTACHLRTLLLTANYAKKNNRNERIYGREYGIPFNKVTDIGFFFNNFYHLRQPWLMKVDIDEISSMYVLTSANTRNLEATAMGKLRTKFRECLKNDNDDHIIQFASFFLMSARKIQMELSGIDFWDIYPSSEKDKLNNDLLFFVKNAAHSFGTRFRAERMFQRTKDTLKRHNLSATKRLKNGCIDEFNSIVVNPWYREKLAGKSVAIIDDFTRFGTSCETVRHLLQKEGVAKIVFIAMGKFGNDVDYHKYEYDLDGSVFEGVTAKLNSHDIIKGVRDDNSVGEFLNSLRTIIV